jgi:D-alanine--poly(phosphoribitol) ligase subunit 1
LIDRSFSGANLPSLSHFVFCGEILTKATALKLRQKFPSAKILNLYGPTEATCATTGIDINDDILAKYDVLPVGYVKPGTSIYIDDGLNGKEIVIVGTNVSHGYINDKEKTRAQFFKMNGVRAYRTGDYGFFENDNLLFVKGRIDRQVKFKGYRIELEEIESVMRQVLDVSNILCLPVYNEDKITELVAVFFNDQKYTYKELVEKLNLILPDYMIPTKIKNLNQLPLTSNGKLDRKAVENLIAQNIE